jgi:hypothetical protein
MQQTATETPTELERSADFAIPLAGITAARLEFPRGAARVALAADPTMADDLCRGHFDGRPPRVSIFGTAVRLDYRGLWVLGGPRAATITLNAAVAWEIVFEHGAARIVADLRALRSLRSFVVGGGVSNAELVLPRPSGAVPVRIRGGASRATISRPAGVPVSLEVDGGVSRLVLDDQRWGAMSGPIRMHSPSADGADRYQVQIHGGASRLAITTY